MKRVHMVHLSETVKLGHHNNANSADETGLMKNEISKFLQVTYTFFLYPAPALLTYLSFCLEHGLTKAKKLEGKSLQCPLL